MAYLIILIILSILTLCFASIIVLIRKKPKVNEILQAFELAVSALCLLVILLGLFMNH